VWGTGCGAQGMGHRAWGTGCGAQGMGHRVWGTGYGHRVWGTGRGAQGTAYGAQGITKTSTQHARDEWHLLWREQEAPQDVILKQCT
jgi:hypothetical protein